MFQYVYWALPGWSHKIMKETIDELNSLLVMGDQCTGSPGVQYREKWQWDQEEKNQTSGYWIYIKASCKFKIGNSFIWEAQ